MEHLFTIDNSALADSSSSLQQVSMQALENGQVLYLPHKTFALLPEEKFLLSPTIAKGKAKNISMKFSSTSAASKISGSSLEGTELLQLTMMMQRYVAYATDLVTSLCPHYQAHLIRGRTSFRPIEIKGRASSYKKDDKRLHVDAFPATPVQGKRILRVFCNINPHGEARVWHLGEPFHNVAQRFLPRIAPPKTWQARLLKLFKMTKSLRTPYDHYMLNIHDKMKGDLAYQAQTDKIRMDFPPHSSWITYTDVTSHAALGGQFLLEQTFYLEPTHMLDEAKSPLRILEKLKGEALHGSCFSA